MSKSILLGLAAILILSVSVYAADIPQSLDPTVARTREGLVEREDRAPETGGVLALLGEEVYRTNWRDLGIYGNGYDGAGISIDPETGYLYLASQYYVWGQFRFRIWVLDVIDNIPVRLGMMWVPLKPGYRYDPVWGMGYDMGTWNNEGPRPWYTVADFYTPHMLEMTPWPVGAWTGKFTTFYEYAWYGDLAEWDPSGGSDYVYACHVGNDNNIIELRQTPGGCSEVTRFGHGDWNYISQRALSYCPDNEKFYIGGWNSDRLWEYDRDKNTNTASIAIRPGIAGCAFDFINDPPGAYLWVQHNSTSDDLCKIEVYKPVPDLDCDDNNGNNNGNTVTMTGFRGSSVAGTFVIVNPGGGASLTAPNVDYWDGPSQRDLDLVTYSSTDLERLHPANGKKIPAACVSFTGPSSLDNPSSAQCMVQVDIPWVSGGGQFPWTYSGTATITGEPEHLDWTTDSFTLTVKVVAGQAPGDGSGPNNAFWGFDHAGVNELRWGEFTFGNGGYNLYKAESGSETFEKLNGALTYDNSYVDGDVLEGRTYAYKLGVLLGNGQEYHVGPINITRGLRPEVHMLSGSFPNPVSDATEIRYGIASDAEVSLKVYNAAGQVVETLVNEYRTPGYYSASWNAEDAANGVYFYRLTAGDFSSTGKLVVLR
jgi:hypothetical protein